MIAKVGHHGAIDHLQYRWSISVCLKESSNFACENSFWLLGVYEPIAATRLNAEWSDFSHSMQRTGTFASKFKSGDEMDR
jgi:hypothetical protein